MLENITVNTFSFCEHLTSVDLSQLVALGDALSPCARLSSLQSANVPVLETMKGDLVLSGFRCVAVWGGGNELCWNGLLCCCAQSAYRESPKVFQYEIQKCRNRLQALRKLPQFSADTNGNSEAAKK